MTKCDQVEIIHKNIKPRRETGFIEGGRWQARTADLCRVKTALILNLSRINPNFQASVSTENVSTMWLYLTISVYIDSYPTLYLHFIYLSKAF